MINRDGGVTCYQQLSEILLNQIESGLFKPGHQLPTETELSKRYKLNRHTVRQGLGRLEDKGFVYKIKGKGTFVANNKIAYKVSEKTRFTTSILEVGLSPDAELLDFYEISAGNELAQKLRISPDDKVVVLEILRHVNTIPFCQTTSFLSAQKFPGLHNHLQGNFSLYALLKERFQVETTRTSSSFEVSWPETMDMDRLHISPKVPILIVKSLSKDQEENIVEYCLSRFRGDLCSFTLEFEK
jgi:phosphonate metabolism transcriptional regulator PhnF